MTSPTGIPAGIKVTDIAFVRFMAPDLDVMEQYFTDFGMHRSDRTDSALYMRGTDDEGFVHVTHKGDEAGFIGLAFNAASIGDLEQLAQHDDFGDVIELDGPGAGHSVTATDPNGFRVEVVANRGSVGCLPSATRPVRNDAAEQPRLGAPLRLDSGPSHVKRLGHVVLDVVDFRESEAWYKKHFGLVTSDEIVLNETRSLGAFMRCDRGAMHVDHHTLFCVGRGEAGFNHAAFEVADFDDIYDYWRDPYGHMVERSRPLAGATCLRATWPSRPCSRPG